MTDQLVDPDRLLASTEPPPVMIHNAGRQAPWVFLCEHAGNRIPASLNMLGLPQSEINRHIGWDIGILDVAIHLADKLQAPLFYQTYSRLVIDCNRPLTSAELIPEISDNTVVPANRSIPPRDRERRILEIWRPYQQAIRSYLEPRAGSRIFVISLHSFTPVLGGKARPWHVGLLFNRHPRVADALNERLAFRDKSLIIGLNQPYTVTDEDDYTIPEFGEAMGFPHALIEIRQDLLAGRDDREKWVDLLTDACRDLIDLKRRTAHD
jgi:predicted N-formylglutamate amidohydrolase